MKPPCLEDLYPHAEKLPSLPEVVNHLLHVMNDEGADVDTLVTHLNTDPAIVVRMLSAANSVASGLSTNIGSVRQAFIILGVERVTNIILASCVVHHYNSRYPGFDARLMWEHAIGVGICAQVLSVKAGMVHPPEKIFTAGLLHDIGQLLMFAASPKCYLDGLSLRNESNLPLIEAEKAIFGYDHTQAGEVLAKVWNLPDEITEAIVSHHEPDEFGSDTACLIHLSEVLAHALDLGERQNNRVPGLSELACAHLGLDWPMLTDCYAEIEARFTAIRLALAS